MVLPYDQLWAKYERVTKERACIVLFGYGLFSAKLIMSRPKLYRYSLIWHKSMAVGFLNAKKKPMNAHEDIMVFYKALPTYNPQMTEGKPYKKGSSGKFSTNYGKVAKKGPAGHNPGLRYPRSVLEFQNSNHKSLHPTAKPLPLIEWLVKTYTNPGDLVLDNCMGFGTTGVACFNTGRSFIGIEKAPHYFDIAKNRLETAQNN